MLPQVSVLKKAVQDPVQELRGIAAGMNANNPDAITEL